jgi:hypothetical protein
MLSSLLPESEKDVHINTFPAINLITKIVKILTAIYLKILTKNLLMMTAQKRCFNPLHSIFIYIHMFEESAILLEVFLQLGG